MAQTMVVHGSPSTGSVLVEAALTLLELPYRLADPTAYADYDDALEQVTKVNPMRQLPALELPDGQIMTESAAILIWLTETYGDHRLAPGVGDPLRPAFLRWMVFLSAQIYGHFWVMDEPARVVTDKAQEAVVRERLGDRIAHNWAVLESQTDPGPYVLGERMTPIDLYVALVSRWRPGRKRLHAAAPKLGEVARRVDADPRLQALWAERFPFPKGWEG